MNHHYRPDNLSEIPHFVQNDRAFRRGQNGGVAVCLSELSNESHPHTVLFSILS